MTLYRRAIRLNKMKTRTITGFFFIIIMVASVLSGHYVFGVFYLLLSLFCLWEFYRLVKQNTANPNASAGLLNAGLGYIIAALFTYADKMGLPVANTSKLAHQLVLLLPISASIVFITELYRKKDGPVTNIAYTFFGILFAVVPFIFFHALAYIGNGFNFHFPLAFLIILWTNDTGAYLSGYFFGRTKLFERHSPKKTWEGFIGGVIFSAIAAYIIGIYYTDLKWSNWVVVALLISCFGTLGDLVESMFKRSINVKDSGGILPGHGGLLDRFDGLLLAAPVVYTYLYFITNY